MTSLLNREMLDSMLKVIAAQYAEDPSASQRGTLSVSSRAVWKGGGSELHLTLTTTTLTDTSEDSSAGSAIET